MYKKLRGDGKKFEVVFVSSDKDDAAFKEYHGEMPWLALPFADRERKSKLSGKYKVRSAEMLRSAPPVNAVGGIGSSGGGQTGACGVVCGAMTLGPCCLQGRGLGSLSPHDNRPARVPHNHAPTSCNAQVNGIPTLVLLKGNGELITTGARPISGLLHPSQTWPRPSPENRQ